MSDFINTIDQIGDSVVLDSIVDGTITEYKDDVIKSIRNYAFYQRMNLTTVDLPKATMIGSNAFSGCKKLSVINLPSVTTTGEKAFFACGVTTIHIPVITTISESALSLCNNLITIDLPVVKTIEEAAFDGSQNLTNIILRNTTIVSLSNKSAFRNTPIANGTGYIYVPRALLSETDVTSDYRQASNWANYSTQFRALEEWTVDGTITGELDWDKINAAA